MVVLGIEYEEEVLLQSEHLSVREGSTQSEGECLFFT